MKTLEQIKEVYAKSHAFDDWKSMYSYLGLLQRQSAMDEIAQIYATEYAKEALRLASENARVMTKNIDTENELEVLSWTDSRNVKFSVSKQSIISENNLPKHR